METPKQFSPEEILALEKERELRDSELLNGGAVYTFNDQNGKKVLSPTEEQIAKIENRGDMDGSILRDIRKKFGGSSELLHEVIVNAEKLSKTEEEVLVEYFERGKEKFQETFERWVLADAKKFSAEVQNRLALLCRDKKEALKTFHALSDKTREILKKKIEESEIARAEEKKGFEERRDKRDKVEKYDADFTEANRENKERDAEKTFIGKIRKQITGRASK